MASKRRALQFSKQSAMSSVDKRLSSASEKSDESNEAKDSSQSLSSSDPREECKEVNGKMVKPPK